MSKLRLVGSENGEPNICFVVLNDDISTHSSGAQMMITQAISAVCAMPATFLSVKNDGFNVARAARLLGLGRATLYRRIAELEGASPVEEKEVSSI